MVPNRATYHKWRNEILPCVDSSPQRDGKIIVKGRRSVSRIEALRSLTFSHCFSVVVWNKSLEKETWSHLLKKPPVAVSDYYHNHTFQERDADMQKMQSTAYKSSKKVI